MVSESSCCNVFCLEVKLLIKTQTLSTPDAKARVHCVLTSSALYEICITSLGKYASSEGNFVALVNYASYKRTVWNLNKYASTRISICFGYY